MNVAGAVALVTGANRGIGRSFVEALVDRGAAKVYAAARRPGELANAFRSEKVVGLQLDVTDQAQVEATAKKAADVTLLINNAGVSQNSGLLDTGSVEPFKWELDVNVVGMARMALSFVPVIENNLERQLGGSIVNMLSAASLFTAPHVGTYSASKMAAMALTQGLRCDLAERGLEVFGVYVGVVDTDMGSAFHVDKMPPLEAANRVLDGVEAGTTEIDVDERARMLRQAIRDDPEKVEKQMWQRAAEMRVGMARIMRNERS